MAVILTSTNKDSGQPGLDYARMFLSAGKHVVSADKGLVIHGGASGTTPAAASVLRDIVNIHRGYQF